MPITAPRLSSLEVTGGVEFYRRPQLRRFQQAEEATVAQHLDEVARLTSVYTIATPEELQLGADGRTRRGGYRYSTHAFTQVTQLLALGATRFLTDLAGMRARSYARPICGSQALRIFNDLVALRFAVFGKYCLVRDDSAKRIDGFVGINRRVLENAAFFQRAREMLPAGYAFHGAALVGRRFVVWFRAERPLLTLQVPHNWALYTGYYLSNSEISGTSVRGTAALFSPDGVSLGPFRRYGVCTPHKGSEFAARFGRLLSEVFCELPSEEICVGARQLLETSLGFAADAPRCNIKRRIEHLVFAFSQLGVEKRIAQDVVQRTLHVAAADDLLLASFAKQFAKLTLFNLYVTAIRMAARQDLSRRERLSQAAFEVLIGRFSL